jgi:hypothetical protein
MAPYIPIIRRAGSHRHQDPGRSGNPMLTGNEDPVLVQSVFRTNELISSVFLFL